MLMELSVGLLPVMVVVVVVVDGEPCLVLGEEDKLSTGCGSCNHGRVGTYLTLGCQKPTSRRVTSSLGPTQDTAVAEVYLLSLS